MHDHVANIPPDVTTNDIERMQEEPASNAGTCGNFMQQHLSTEHEEELFAVAVRGINEPAAEASALDQVPTAPPAPAPSSISPAPPRITQTPSSPAHLMSDRGRTDIPLR